MRPSHCGFRHIASGVNYQRRDTRAMREWRTHLDRGIFRKLLWASGQCKSRSVTGSRLYHARAYRIKQCVCSSLKEKPFGTTAEASAMAGCACTSAGQPKTGL